MWVLTLSAQVLLVPYEIGLRQPRAKVGIEVAHLGEPEFVEVIPRRKRLDPAKARVFEASGQDYVPIQPSLPRRDLGERHSHLKRDAGLLGENAHRADCPDGGDHPVKERPNRGRFAAEVMRERVPAAGMRLIPIGELASALLALPEAWPVGHGN